MNWGGFAGGFSQGFNNGVNIGKTLAEATKQKKIADLAKQGIVEATAARQADIDKKITENLPQQEATPAKDVEVAPIETPQAQVSQITPQGETITPASAAPTTPETITPQATTPPASVPQVAASEGIAPRKRFSVGGQEFDTREDAMKAAEKQVGSIQDYQTNTIFPKMQQFYMEQGDVATAQKYADFAESQRGKAAIKLHSQALGQLMFGGDVDKGIKMLGDYYNKFIDDGVDFVGGKANADGTYTVTTKTKGGKTNEVQVDKKQIMAMAMAYDPSKLVQMGMDQVKSEEATRSEIAKENRAEARDNRKSARDQANKIEYKTIEVQLEAANASSKVKREVNAKVEFLRNAGYSDAFINEALPGIIGIGDYKKKTSPEEARRLAFSDRMKNDMTFSRKSPEDQQKLLDQDMKLIYGGVDPKTAPANPAAQGLPTQPPKQGGIPVFDTKTGKIIYK
jgi:hypothetical protein